MRITKQDILETALSMLENRKNPTRDEMKRAACSAVWKLVQNDGASIEEMLSCLNVEFDYEESLESKIDKLLWQVFAEVVVWIDKEKNRW